jgi:3-hydroxyisobutyrate dehydrogenase
METTLKRETIGFIGTGVMGQSMAGHLLAAGHDVHIHTRTPAKAEGLLQEGAIWEASSASLSAACDMIITMVGYPADVEALYLGEGGIIANAHAGALLIDMTTSSPGLARQIHAEAATKGLGSLDAPVSGGDIGAREAKLSIMVGGDQKDFDRAIPVLGLLGKNIVLQGGPGSGQHTKMANQIAIAAGMLGVCEALAYARNSGLDPETVLQSISGGAAGSWSLTNLAPRMIQGDFNPGFYVKHFVKDMGIARNSAQSMGLSTPGLDLALQQYQKLVEAGGADLGTQGLYKLYQEDTPAAS